MKKQLAIHGGSSRVTRGCYCGRTGDQAACRVNGKQSSPAEADASTLSGFGLLSVSAGPPSKSRTK